MKYLKLLTLFELYLALGNTPLLLLYFIRNQTWKTEKLRQYSTSCKPVYKKYFDMNYCD